uniref:PK_Tyr_Ser-Thr domain-containing protein n=1 Tax=Panagrellus redivivus TaxID=6233 RepID=A0A7E4VVW2_PANRE
MELELLERLTSMPTFSESRKPEIHSLANQCMKEANPSTSMFDDRRQCLGVGNFTTRVQRKYKKTKLMKT